MKISSNFHDYYDSLRAMDQDPDPLYVRLTKAIDLVETWEYQRNRRNRQIDPEFEQNRINSYILRERCIRFSDVSWFESSAIAFCGRIFPYVSVGFGKDAKFAYTPERARKIVQQYQPLNQPYDAHFAEGIKNQKRLLLNEMDAPFSPYHNYFQYSQWYNYLQQNQCGDAIFRHFKAPVIAWDGRVNAQQIILNPILRQYDFGQVVLPPVAYQELSMFIGNNLADLNKKPTRPISDKLKAESKGFDKWSFKNTKNRAVWTSIDNAEPNGKGYDDDPNWKKK